MGVRFLHSFRKRYYKDEMYFCNKFALRALPFDLITERHKKLNDSNFRSELWFIGLLKTISIKIDCHRNYPILNRYFADFFFNKINVVVEIDGKSHDDSKEYDDKRDAVFAKRNLKVIRVKFGDLIAAEKAIIEIISLNKNKNETKIKLIKSNKKVQLKKHKNKYWKRKQEKIQKEMDRMILATLSSKIIIRRKNNEDNDLQKIVPF